MAEPTGPSEPYVWPVFGENFTVEGLADTEVCIGDRYRIGAALFEVTQPRVTCYRVGIRMNEPEMAALLVKHGRPGFYFRVIEEGEVEAGDEITQVAAGPERVSVFEIWRPSFRSLLELAEACDVPVRWSCRTGVCHACETGLVAGTIGYRPDPLDAPATAMC